MDYALDDDTSSEVARLIGKAADWSLPQLRADALANSLLPFLETLESRLRESTGTSPAPILIDWLEVAKDAHTGLPTRYRLPVLRQPDTR